MPDPVKLILTTGYEVILNELDGLQHLCNAVIGESIGQVTDSGLPSDEIIGALMDRAYAELHYVAGQLAAYGYGISREKLLEEFGVVWDELAARYPGQSSDEPDDASDGAATSPCYLCQIDDPNEVPFDPDEHRICLICAVKLWELAREELAFDLRGSVISVSMSEDSDVLD